MLGKKISDICSRRLQWLGSNKILESLASFGEQGAFTQSRKNEAIALNQENRRDDEHFNAYGWKVDYRALLIPVLYIASQKYDKASCFFGRSGDRLEVRTLFSN